MGIKGICEADALEKITNYQIEAMTKSVGESLDYIDPPLKTMLESFMPTLKDRFPWLVALVVLGSGANGGMTIRRALDRVRRTANKTDLDYAIIFDPQQPPNTKDVYELRVALDALLRDSGGQYGFPATFFGCSNINGQMLRSADLGSIAPETGGNPNPYLYLRPSVPANVNLANRQKTAHPYLYTGLDRLLYDELPQDQGFSWREKYFTDNFYSLPAFIRNELNLLLKRSPQYLVRPYHLELIRILNIIKANATPTNNLRRF